MLALPALRRTCSDARVAVGGCRDGRRSYGEQRRLETGGVVDHGSAGEGFQFEEAGPQGGQPGVEVPPHSAGTLVVT